MPSRHKRKLVILHFDIFTCLRFPIRIWYVLSVLRSGIISQLQEYLHWISLFTIIYLHIFIYIYLYYEICNVSRMFCPKEGGCELHKCLGTRPSVILVDLCNQGWLVWIFWLWGMLTSCCVDPKEGGCELHKCLGQRPSVVIDVLIDQGWFNVLRCDLEVCLVYVVFTLKRAVVNCTNV